jgi:hypothetical protein
VKIGVISDTHGYLDPKILPLFAGVEHIFHAGDIGYASIILELEQVAPVTAVLGNNDFDMTFEETEVVELAEKKFLVHHILVPTAPHERIKSRIARENPDVVIFGHSHQAHTQTLGRTLYFNPGYAGRPRFNQPRSA